MATWTPIEWASLITVVSAAAVLVLKTVFQSRCTSCCWGCVQRKVVDPHDTET